MLIILYRQPWRDFKLEQTEFTESDNKDYQKGCPQVVDNPSPDEQKIYTARDVADAYVEGFKDGYNTALQNGHHDEDVEGYG